MITIPNCRLGKQTAIKRLNETEMGHSLRRPCPAVEQPLGTNLNRLFQSSGQAHRGGFNYRGVLSLCS